MNNKGDIGLVLSIILFVLLILIVGYLLFYITGMKESSQKLFFISNQTIKDNNTPIFNSDISDEYPEGILFYPKMRFSTNHITYTIDESCPETRVKNAQEAFAILENETILNFEELSKGGQTLVSCSDDIPFIDDTLFIAGEGGPVIINSSNRVIITNGSVLLYEDSKCSKPIVAIHEILHVIGFQHSSNEESIMYNMSDCNQKITSEIVNKIEELYQEESLADLFFKNISAVKHANYLDIEFTVSNSGFKKSEKTNVQILGENDKVTTDYDIEELNLGEGLIINFKNIKIGYSTKEIKLVIDSFDKVKELNEQNNIIVLELVE